MSDNDKKVEDNNKDDENSLSRDEEQSYSNEFVSESIHS